VLRHCYDLCNLLRCVRTDFLSNCEHYLMISYRKPSVEALRRVLARQRHLDFTYPKVGATAHELRVPPEGRREAAALDSSNPPASNFALPASYVVDQIRVELGTGQAVFDRAQAALRGWKQFELGWLEAFPNDTPLVAGETVLVVARAGGFWWTNAARIVYTIEERPTRSRALDSHTERCLATWSAGKSGS
jgi:hypothetical protein